jgi:hypothetical protein
MKATSMLSGLYLKLFGGLAALLVVVGLFLGLRHYKSLADSRGEKLEVICKTTREASGHPKLACGDVPAQIQFLGEAVTALGNAIRTQNAAVANLGAESERQKAAAAKASQIAQERARGAEAVADRLIASSRSTGPQSAPCKASKAVEEAWHG